LTPIVWNMLKLELLELFAFSMEIDTTYASRNLVEADIIETFEACAINSPDTVVWDEEVFLPPHKDVVPLRKVLVCKILPFCLFGKGSPSLESRPVLHVHLLIGAPFRMFFGKSVFRSDDFAFEVGSQARVVFRQALNAQVAAQKRLFHINVLDLHLNIVDLTVRLLIAMEFASRS